MHDAFDSERTQQEAEDLVLTVQTLQFQGDVDQMKRPRTSFKYKTITDGNKHRMFVKEVVTETDFGDEDRSSQLTCYYFDDYVKYLCNSDRSRPASSKSSLFLKGISSHYKEHKATQVDINQPEPFKIIQKIEPKIKTLNKSSPKQEFKDEVRPIPEQVQETIENTKIAYQKSGKRKSLTISRTQSPETVQVIRVDVVCNNATSSKLPNYEETKKADNSSEISIPKVENINMKNNHFAHKYLLTNSIKTLDESLSGGSKVTLLCKTFKLSDRSPKLSDNSSARKERKYTKALKNITKNDSKVMKNRK